jgi:hypothetical protein
LPLFAPYLTLPYDKSLKKLAPVHRSSVELKGY